MKQRWKIGQTACLDVGLNTPFGQLPAGTVGEVLDVTSDRAKVRFDAGEVWVDQEQLRSETISLDESRAT